MAMALMVCITFKLKLVGLFGSFLRKKYMLQIYLKFRFQNYFTNIVKQKRLPKMD